MKAVYSEFGAIGPTCGPFEKLFKERVGAAKGIGDADCLILWGGTDIHPQLYGQFPHPKNQINVGAPIPQRDLVEWHLLREAYEKGIFIIGICRGAQLLTVFAGGSLVQHVTGHQCGHEIETHDGKKFHAPADHHQMMVPDNVPDYELLAWSIKRSTSYEGQKLQQTHSELFDLDIEPEIIYYPSVKGIAIQPHPEWGPVGTEFNNWLLNEIETRMKNV